MVKSIERRAFEGAFSWSCRKRDRHLKVPLSAKILTDIPIVGLVASLVYLIIYTTSDSTKAKMHLKSVPIVIMTPQKWLKGDPTDELYNAAVARFAIGIIPLIGRIALIALDLLGSLMNSGHDRSLN